MKKKIIAGAIAGAALLASVAPAFGHGMGTGPAAIDPEAPSCMGQLASMHAKRFKGVPNTDHINYNGSGRPNLVRYEDVQDQMHGFQDYCSPEADQ